ASSDRRSSPAETAACSSPCHTELSAAELPSPRGDAPLRKSSRRRSFPHTRPSRTAGASYAAPSPPAAARPLRMDWILCSRNLFQIKCSGALDVRLALNSELSTMLIFPQVFHVLPVFFERASLVKIRAVIDVVAFD